MTFRGKIALIGAVAACALSAIPAQAATTVDIASTATGTTLFLEAGNYVFNFIGTAQGGAYDAWKFSNALYGCNSAGSNCTRGWLVNVAVDLGNAGVFDRTNGLYYWQEPLPTETHYYSTPEGAIDQAIQAAFLTTPLIVPSGYVRPAATEAPFAFSLASAQNVNFFVKDNIYTDNVAGVSLSLSSVPAVPEPATWAMMLAGFGALGFAMRRRIAPAAVTFG